MSSTPDEPIIVVRDVSKTYRLGDIEVHALRGVSLTVRRGEFVAVMGASGSGKSTLMNILGCLDAPSTGSYLLEGVDVAKLDEPSLARIRGRRIGFVFQSFNLLPRTSAVENVELPLFYSGQISGNLRRANEMLDLLGLGDRTQNQPNQLSGGQQQRVAIARAIVGQPDILIMDEPTASLDGDTGQAVVGFVKQHVLNEKRCILIVTHDNRIYEFATRILKMEDGRLTGIEKGGSA